MESRCRRTLRPSPGLAWWRTLFGLRSTVLVQPFDVALGVAGQQARAFGGEAGQPFGVVVTQQRALLVVGVGIAVHGPGQGAGIDQFEAELKALDRKST